MNILINDANNDDPYNLHPLLSTLSTDISTSHNLFTSKLLPNLLEPNSSRLTGTTSLRNLNTLAHTIESSVPGFQLNISQTCMHCPRIHEAMRSLHRFRPFWLDDGVCEEISGFVARYEELSRRWRDVRRVVDKVLLQQQRRREQPVNVVIVTYTEKLQSIKQQLRDFREDIRIEKGYIKSEKRVAVRLLAATRRFGMVLRDRVSMNPLCLCRGGFWEKEVAERLGVPLVGVQVGVEGRGFAPV
ncbi:hypothetical protein TWF730_003276 [Orbilia blumenaviensis]|uniref:Uncharacterized protein n=1 Tax=Orbilia blumenaviensis TaxID=1796055 RepID=A0AAV9U4U9_9PEZI